MDYDLPNFLESEYKAANAEPVFMRLHNKKYLVPYPYVRDYKDYKKAFLNDFFDIMRKDYLAYQKHNLPVQYITWHDDDKHRKLIVPYDLRNKQVSPQEVANRIFKRAEKKYIKAVRLSMELAKAYPDRPYQTLINVAHVRDMQKANYEHQLKLARDKAVYITKKVGRFLAQNAVKATNNLKNLDVENLKVKARRWAVGVMLTTTITGAVYAAFQINEKQTEKKEIKAKDPLGHAQMFERCHDAIKVSLAFAENFADSAFKDGEGVPTIGYGCTYYLDANGNGSRETSPVKMDDKITMEDANTQKERYLKFEILKQVQENVKVPMDEETTIATYNFAYVLGSTNFKKSEYLRALNEGKKGSELARYLTGFRVQKGLLPRFYFMGALLNGQMKVSDFMELTAEGCYNLKAKDVCLYEKGKLKLDEDGFAHFCYDRLAENIEQAKKSRRSKACGGKKCPQVKEILPQSVLDGVRDMENTRARIYYADITDLSR